MKGGATGLGWRMFDTLRSRMMALILVSTLGVVALLAYFAVTRIDQAMFVSEKQNAMNLLQSTLLNVENVYRGLVYSEQVELERRKANLKSSVDFALGIVEAYYNEFKQGVHSENESKELAMAALDGLRYDEHGYFFCFDTNYVPLVHPIMKHLKNLYNSQDSKGNYLFREMVEVVKKDGAGFVKYWWPMPGEEQASEKISYVRFFPAWDLVVGSGVYTQDLSDLKKRRLEAVEDDLRLSFSRVRIAGSGYMFLFNSKKEMVIHPVLWNEDTFGKEAKERLDVVLDQLIANVAKGGTEMYYYWDKPSRRGDYSYQKIAFLTYFEPLDWYIAVTAYVDEITAHGRKLGREILYFSMLFLSVVWILSFVLSKTLSIHIRNLTEAVRNVAPETMDESIVPVGGTSETRRLGRFIRQMIAAMRSALEDKRRAALETETSRQTLRDLLDYAPAAISLRDLEGRYTMVNMRYAEIFSEGKRISPGMALDGVFDQNHVDKINREDESILSSDRPIQYEETRAGPEEELIFETTKFPLKDATKKIYAICSFSTDITRRKKAEEELAAHSDRLENLVEERTAELRRTNVELVEAKKVADRALRVKSEFLANISHEIRTPLNGIIGAGDLALSEKLTPRVEHFLRIVRSSARSLLGIINDLLDFSKVEAGRLKLESRGFDLNSVLQEVGELFIHQAEKKNIDLLFEINPRLPRELIGDPLRLKQVLVNLAGNAIKFTEPGGVVEIRGGASAIDGEKVWLEFRVMDTGVGVPAERLGKLFKPFTQADASTTRRYGGTGLGLSISKHLVEMMDGEIWVKSVSGEGSTFGFSVELGLPPEGEAPWPPTDAFAGRSVLAVEANARVRSNQMSICRGLGCRVAGAESIEAALKLIAAGPGERGYDAVIQGSGFELEDGAEFDRIVREAGFAGMVVKPISLSLEEASASASVSGKYRRVKVSKPLTRLSMYKALAAAFKVESERGGPAKERVAEDPALRLEGKKVLVVEDNEVNREITLSILEDAGIKATAAENGREALEAVRSEKFDAVLMDVQMPVMDGYETSRAIRKDPGLAFLPIIAMSAHSSVEHEAECVRSGMNRYVIKPVDRNKLFKVLNEVIYGSEKTEEGEMAEAKPEEAPRSGRVIDVQDALRRIGCTKEYYLDLVSGFLDAKRDTAALVGEALESGDFAQVGKLAHALKGAAGNLSAFDLYDTAADMEREARDELEERIWSLIPALEINFEEAQLFIDEFRKKSENSLGNGALAKEDPKEGREPLGEEEFSRAAVDLERALSAADPVRSEELARYLSERTGQGEILSILKEILASAKDYDFDRGVELANRLLENPGRNKPGRGDES